MSNWNGFAIDARRIVELGSKLAEAEARADEYYELNEKLLDKVEELEWNYGIAIKELEATITELTAALERIAGRRNCYNDINGCGASQDAKLALKQE